MLTAAGALADRAVVAERRRAPRPVLAGSRQPARMSPTRFRRALAVTHWWGSSAPRLRLRVVEGRPLLGDALEFQQQANLLASGHGLIEPRALVCPAHRPAQRRQAAGLSVARGGVSLLGGRSWAWHDIVDLVAGTATVWVTGLLGRWVGGARTGLIAAGLAAVYPLLIAADGSLRSESVFALFVTLSLLCALRLREDGESGT